MEGWLVERLRRASRTRPQDEAYTFLSFSGDSAAATIVSYGELDGRALAVAAELAASGARGERALLLYPPGVDYVVALLGCLYAGAVAVPTYPPFDASARQRVERIAADARPAVVLTTASLAAAAHGSEGTARIAPGARWVATDGLEPRRHIEDVPVKQDEDAAALLQYTSGSTRAPRGVRITYGNLMANCEAIGTMFAFVPEDRGVIWLPPYHDMGLIGGVLQPLYWAFPCVLMSPLDFVRRPARWLEAITNYGGTVSGGPDFAYSLCAARVSGNELRALGLATWRLAFTGAEPVRPATLEAFAGRFAPAGFRRAALYPCYGLAESTLMVTGARPGGGPRIRHYSAEALERGVAEPAGTGGRCLASCGVPAAGHTVTIVDPSTREPLAEHRVGEILVSGPSVAAGYFGERGDTIARFGSAGSVHQVITGDLGFLDGGELIVTGRIDDLLVVRGRNLYPQDIEATAERAHPGLRIGSAAAFQDGDGAPVIVQEVSRRALGGPLADMASAVRGAVASEHGVTLHTVALVPPGTVPKTSSGKVQRRRCRVLLSEGRLATLLVDKEGDGNLVPAPPTPPGGGWRTNRRLLEDFILAELARRCPGVAPELDRTIVAHGLDSLGVTDLANRIRADLGVEVAPEQLLNDMTPAALVDLIAAELSASPSPAPPESRPQRVPRHWAPEHKPGP